MFDGVPADQFHQLIASSRASSLPIIPANNFPNFDPYPSSHQTLQPHHLDHLSSPPPPPEDEASKQQGQTTLVSTSLALERERSAWSNEEVLALLRIRSSMESWIPDFSWELVSRKLAEVGFKRSAEKCKEKFEEEEESGNNLNSLSFNKNMRFLSELDELYQQQGDQKLDNHNMTNHNNLENEQVFTTMSRSKSNTKKRKRSSSNSSKNKRQYEMFKGLCEAIAERIMAQQEELHNKIIEDMMKREEEKIAKDEAWKSQEMVRLNKEFEIREREHEIASNRHAKIIEFLNKFSSSSHPSSSQDQSLLEVTNNIISTPNSTQGQPQNASSSYEMISTNNQSNKKVSHHHNKNPSSFLSSSTSPLDDRSQNGGKRWPREEVLALINLRCSSINNNIDNNNKDNGSKSPLWERISQGMKELGYNRSSKRCKEKWENINKYFRKTKDNIKKRSIDSRTCPYFHQLSTLYSHGNLS